MISSLFFCHSLSCFGCESSGNYSDSFCLLSSLGELTTFVPELTERKNQLPFQTSLHPGQQKWKRKCYWMARWSAKPQLGFQPGHMGPREPQKSPRMCVCFCVCLCVSVCWGWGQKNVFHGFQGGTHMTQIAGFLVRFCF